MKTQLVTLALLLFSTGAFAQTLEQSFRNLIAEFKQNPYAYVKGNYTNDFRFIAGHNGEFRTKDRMVGPDTKVEDIQATDLKFYESGDLAVVSGINTTRFASPKGGQASTYKDAFTYTFRKLNGQWKHVAMQHTKIDYDTPGQVAADEAAIKAVLEGHSQAVLNRDVEKAISYFANSPNTVILYQQPGGGYLRGYELVANAYRKAVTGAKSDEKLTTADYRYRILGSSAFVTYIETYTKPDGVVSRTSTKANYMEKEGGQWKMVSNFWMEDKKAK